MILRYLEGVDRFIAYIERVGIAKLAVALNQHFAGVFINARPSLIHLSAISISHLSMAYIVRVREEDTDNLSASSENRYTALP
jgi:hypothetical protein